MPQRSRKYRNSFDREQRKGVVGPLLRAMRARRGWTQRELAERSGRDQTLISKYERGEVLPDEPQQFVAAYSPTIAEERDFYEAVGLVIPESAWIKSLEAELARDKAFIVDHFEKDVRHLHQLKAAGNGRVALRRAAETIAELKSLSQSTPSGAIHEKYLQLRYEAINAQGLAASATSSRGRSWTEDSGVLRELLLVEHETESQQLRTSCKLTRFQFYADDLHIRRKTSVAAQFFEQISDGGLLTVGHQIWSIGTLLKDYSLLEQGTGFRTLRSKLRKLLDAGKCDDPEFLAYGYQSILQAEINLRLPEAGRTLDEAHSIFTILEKKGQEAEYQKLTLLDSQFRLTRERDRDLAIRILERAYIFKHKRLIQQYERVLRRLKR